MSGQFYTDSINAPPVGTEGKFGLFDHLGPHAGPTSIDNSMFYMNEHVGNDLLQHSSLYHNAAQTAPNTRPSSPIMPTPPSLSVPSSPKQQHLKRNYEESESDYSISRVLNEENLSNQELRVLAAHMQSVSHTAAAEVRRQLHIQSEQKRRRLIKDGFEELRNEVPGCEDKKMSKAVLLQKAIEYMRGLKQDREMMLAELQRLKTEKNF